MSIPVVILRGTPFERGRQHGLKFQGEIAMALANARAAHGEDAHLAARRQAQAAWPAIMEHAPDVAAELEGIASGSGIDPVDILLRSGFEFYGLPPASGCSALVVATPQGALVAQNWDAPLSFAAELVLFLHLGPDGFERAIIAAYGGLCWVGCNGHGLAFVNNDLMLSSSAHGLPSQIVRRLILDEQSVAAAVARLRALPHMGGRSYLLGDASGAVAGVEVAARLGASVNQSTSPVLHTNHALDPEIARDECAVTLQATYPSSQHRYEILRRKLPPNADIAAMTLLLADEEGHPNSVSKAASQSEPSATLFSVIFECGARSLLLCPGAPAQHSYQRVSW
jgi:predicted choloylglycine hydrolase